MAFFDVGVPNGSVSATAEKKEGGRESPNCPQKGGHKRRPPDRGCPQEMVEQHINYGEGKKIQNFFFSFSVMDGECLCWKNSLTFHVGKHKSSVAISKKTYGQ